MNLPPASSGLERIVAAILVAVVAIALLALGAYLAFRPRRRPEPELDADAGSAVEPLVAPGPAPWGAGEVLGVFLLGLVPAAILEGFAVTPGGIALPALIAVAVAYQSLAWTALAVLVVRRVRGDRLARIGWQIPNPAMTTAMGLLGIAAVLVAVCVASAALLRVLTAFMPLEEARALLTGEQEAQKALMPGGPLTAGGLATLLAYAGLAPLGEETLFRGMLYTAVRDRLGRVAAVLVSSVCFTLMHAGQLRYLLVLMFSVAVVLAILRERTGSLLASIIAHAGLNVTAILVWRLHLELPLSG
jgi:membrane protease YdiL (CAAX protease family)